MISVIVPIFNVEGYLPRCLDSIVSQTYKNLEIILVDDGSTDSSGSICDEYADKDIRIRVIHQENRGLSETRNIGIKVANGEYIIMPDGDDALHPRMIEILYNLINSGDYDFSMCYGEKICDVDAIKEREQGLINVSQLAELSSESCMRNLWHPSSNNLFQYCVVWNKLYRHSLIEKIEFSNTGAEDLFYSCLVYLRMNIAIMIPQTLYYYIQHNTSITHQGINKRWVKTLDSMKKCLDSIPIEDRLYRSYCLRGIYKRILSLRLWSKGTPYYQLAKNEIRFIKNLSFREYLFNSYIPLFEKFVILAFYYCPFLYRLFIGIMEFRAKVFT